MFRFARPARCVPLGRPTTANGGAADVNPPSTRPSKNRRARLTDGRTPAYATAFLPHIPWPSSSFETADRPEGIGLPAYNVNSSRSLYRPERHESRGNSQRRRQVEKPGIRRHKAFLNIILRSRLPRAKPSADARSPQVQGTCGKLRIRPVLGGDRHVWVDGPVGGVDNWTRLQRVPVAQLDRASASGAEG